MKQKKEKLQKNKKKFTNKKCDNLLDKEKTMNFMLFLNIACYPLKTINPSGPILNNKSTMLRFGIKPLRCANT